MLSEVENLIREALRDVIIENELVDTGTLLNSIQVSISDNGGISIEGEDYFEYLEQEYNLLQQLEDNPKYITAVDLIIKHLIKEQLNLEDGIN